MMARETARRPSRLALGILNSYGIQNPRDIDLYAICQDRNILVVEDRLVGALARLIRNKNGRAVIRVSNAIREDGKKRFAVAHELGHYELHPDKNQISICLEEHLLDWYRQLPPEEAEANAFAVELLMPTHLFKPRSEHRPATVETITAFKEEFDTSLTASALRYVDFARTQCCVLICVKNTFRWFKASPGFPLRLMRPGLTVAPQSVAGRLFQGGGNLIGPAEVPVQAWVEDSGITQAFTLQEDAVYMQTYNTVLSLVSIVPYSPLDKFLATKEMQSYY